LHCRGHGGKCLSSGDPVCESKLKRFGRYFGILLGNLSPRLQLGSLDLFLVTLIERAGLVEQGTMAFLPSAGGIVEVAVIRAVLGAHVALAVATALRRTCHLIATVRFDKRRFACQMSGVGVTNERVAGRRGSLTFVAEANQRLRHGFLDLMPGRVALLPRFFAALWDVSLLFA
jgi:hypothetical protein